MHPRLILCLKATYVLKAYANTEILSYKWLHSLQLLRAWLRLFRLLHIVWQPSVSIIEVSKLSS